uniref:Retroviral polymerase SH3-like domain-containing protein n=1 Tax=Nicotiana tabacum TaxID=4097 RepID=A0A1S4CFA4_TOBAC|nr:PREDICTED: uncharacterized protein LOC107818369 [Nicotiana tabacum]
MYNWPSMLANAVTVTHYTDSKAKDDEWIVDTGETNHITSNSEMISKPKEQSKSIGEKVHLPNGDSLAVGSFELDQGIISNEEVKGTDKQKGDLYYWPHSDRDRVQASAALCMTNEEELWYRRLGHIPHKIYLGMQVWFIKVPASTPQQNGVNAIYLINRIPSTTLAGKSPFEMFYGRPDKLQHVRVLGSLYYATATDRSDKFGARAEPVVHMGYSSTKKAYRLYSLTNNYFFISRDVSFKEYNFPFKTTTSTGRRTNAKQFIDTDDAFIIDPTSEVSKIALDSVVAPSPSLEASSAPTYDDPSSEALPQPHLL